MSINPNLEEKLKSWGVDAREIKPQEAPVEVIKAFYPDIPVIEEKKLFNTNPNKIKKQLNKICPQCKSYNLQIVDGKFGEFIGCSGFSKVNCRYHLSLDQWKGESLS